MTRLSRSGDIIELALLMQNSYCGFTIDDIANYFECSRRTAERMKNIIAEKFPNKLEVVETNSRKKHWRLKRDTINSLITFTQEELIVLQQVSALIKNSSKQKVLNKIIEKVMSYIK